MNDDLILIIEATRQKYREMNFHKQVKAKMQSDRRQPCSRRLCLGVPDHGVEICLVSPVTAIGLPTYDVNLVDEQQGGK